MFKKGIGVIVPLFDVTLCLLMLHSLSYLIFHSVYCYESGGGRRLACLYSCLTHCLSRTCFYPCSGKTSYHSDLHSTPTPPKSRALHQLLQRQIHFSVMIFLLLSIKVNVSVLIQFPPFALMTTCHHVLVILLHPWTLFRYLTRFLKPSLTLVGVVLW